MKLFIQKFGKKYAEENDSKQIKPAYYAAQNGRYSMQNIMLIFLLFNYYLGKLDILQYLLTEVKVDSKARDKGGMTIMHAATTGHQLAVVKVHTVMKVI